MSQRATAPPHVGKNQNPSGIVSHQPEVTFFVSTLEKGPGKHQFEMEE